MGNKTKEPAGDRYAKALQMRKEGLTLKEIGRQLGVSAARAGDIVRHAKYRLANPRPYSELNDLSARAKNCLLSAGYNKKSDVLNAVMAKKIRPNDAMPNYGKKSHREVCEWLGIATPSDADKPNEITIQRYISYLERHGYVVKKKGRKA